MAINIDPEQTTQQTVSPKEKSPLKESLSPAQPVSPDESPRDMPKHKLTMRRIMAIVCIVLLVGMYVATFIVALLDFPGQDRLFQACLVATIGLPILLWIYLWLYDRIREARSQNQEE